MVGLVGGVGRGCRWVIDEVCSRFFIVLKKTRFLGLGVGIIERKLELLKGEIALSPMHYLKCENDERKDQFLNRGCGFYVRMISELISANIFDDSLLVEVGIIRQGFILLGSY